MDAGKKLIIGASVFAAGIAGYGVYDIASKQNYFDDVIVPAYIRPAEQNMATVDKLMKVNQNEYDKVSARIRCDEAAGWIKEAKSLKYSYEREQLKYAARQALDVSRSAYRTAYHKINKMMRDELNKNTNQCVGLLNKRRTLSVPTNQFQGRPGANDYPQGMNKPKKLPPLYRR